MSAERSLDNIGLLAPLAAEERTALATGCRWLDLKTGDQVLNRDSESRDVYFVVDGAVQVVNYSLSGREIAYAVVRAGHYFGEIAAIDGKPRSASVVAIEKCRLAIMDRDVFNRLLQEHGDLMGAVLLKLTQIIRNCDERIMDLSTLGAVQRVYVELLRLAKPDPVTPGSWLIHPVPTQELIASHASTTRETVARVMGQLVKSGLAKRKGRNFYLLDRERLEEMAERLVASVE